MQSDTAIGVGTEVSFILQGRRVGGRVKAQPANHGEEHFTCLVEVTTPKGFAGRLVNVLVSDLTPIN